MSLRDQFQITLPSNVKGNVMNKPGLYETMLATPLELHGEWEVGIMDISYPHNWSNIERKYHMAVLTVFDGEDEEDQMYHVKANVETEALLDGIMNLESFAVTEHDSQSKIMKFYARNVFSIIPGQYDTTSLCDQIETEIKRVRYGLNHVSVTYSKERGKVNIASLRRTAILACYKENSLLRLLGFNKELQTITGGDNKHNEHPFKEIDYLVLKVATSTEANFPPLIKPITNIFVYTDVSAYVLVGDTMAPLLGYFMDGTDWGKHGHHGFNPVFYNEVKERTIRSITMKLCDDRGEVINFGEHGTVICRLHFRRIR